jgi:hypothetical protein
MPLQTKLKARPERKTFAAQEQSAGFCTRHRPPLSRPTRLKVSFSLFRLNVIRMDRENLLHDYRDAEEVLKIAAIMEQYPN